MLTNREKGAAALLTVSRKFQKVNSIRVGYMKNQRKKHDLRGFVKGIIWHPPPLPPYGMVVVVVVVNLSKWRGQSFGVLALSYIF